MAIDKDIAFVTKAPIGVAGSWDYDTVVAMEAPPESFFGDQLSLLQGDQYRLWLRWFLEGMVSPLAASRDASLKRLDILKSVHVRIEQMHPGADALRKRELAERITDHVYAEVERLRREIGRDHADRSTRSALLAERNPPRCYICGFAFSREAQDALLKKPMRDPVVLPKLVDVFRPRLKDIHVSIEIEHVVPVAHGGHGQDNLRLACGWCNRHKSSRVSLYEASLVPAKVSGFTMGPYRIHELPHPFWTVRVLALRKRCQHRDGCVNTADDAEMFISLMDWGGSPNPMNMAIYCEKHDPMKGYRLHGSRDVEALWGERR